MSPCGRHHLLDDIVAASRLEMKAGLGQGLSYRIPTSRALPYHWPADWSCVEFAS
jgi:hypothetical protein